MKFLEWTATFIIISAYLLNVLGYLSSDELLYLFMNIVGAGFLGVVVWEKKVYGAFVIQIFWAIISLLGIIKYFL